jgi:hypothetical protein
MINKGKRVKTKGEKGKNVFIVMQKIEKWKYWFFFIYFNPVSCVIQIMCVCCASRSPFFLLLATYDSITNTKIN